MSEATTTQIRALQLEQLEALAVGEAFSAGVALLDFQGPIPIGWPSLIPYRLYRIQTGIQIDDTLRVALQHVGARAGIRRGQSVGVLLDDVAHHQLWVPPGFAHGFLVLSEVADFCYLCSEYYHPQSEQGIAWDDPSLGISWPALAENTAIQLSAKDQGSPRLAEQSLNCLPGSFF